MVFVTEEAGVYRKVCDYKQGTSGPQAVLAVGSGVTKAIFQVFFKCLAAMFGLGGIG
jgi:hypothetical protein